MVSTPVVNNVLYKFLRPVSITMPDIGMTVRKLDFFGMFHHFLRYKNTSLHTPIITKFEMQVVK